MKDENTEDNPENNNDSKIREIIIVDKIDNGGYKVQPIPREYSRIAHLKIIEKAENNKNKE